MKTYTKFFFSLAIGSMSFLIPFNLIGAAPADVTVVYEEDSYYDLWTGPGWYYGIWFDNEDEYEYWLANNFDDVIWIGPGWYYGFWFDSEPDFHRYKKSHRYHDGERHRGKGQGNPALHQQQYRSQPQNDQQPRTQDHRDQPHIQPQRGHSDGGQSQKSHGSRGHNK